MRLLPISLLFGFILICGCSRELCPENQTNEILSHTNTDEDSYQKELSRLIRLQPDLVLYYFEERALKGSKSYMILKTIGPDFCGKLHVWVPSEDEYSNKLQNKSGYSGSGLKGLQLSFNDIGLPVYQSMTGIID